MRAFLRKNSGGELYDYHMQAAYEGFRALGETQFYATVHALRGNDPAAVIVGSYADLNWLFQDWGITTPTLDYPEELHPFLGRKIWTSTLSTVVNDPKKWGIFIKPLTETRRFTGTVLAETKDLVKLGGMVTDLDIWCSERVDFRAEWRVYVRDGEPIGLHWYAGDWRVQPEIAVVESAVAAYRSAPRGYAIDFGVDAKGRTLLVEVNDGYGLGNYGLRPQPYAELLAARWEEITREAAAAYAAKVQAEAEKK
ncbi:MAG: ATP-grasp domain-containing protein [Veillonellaceae bacterium]|nr:ATP-grasp domain-containing protein [Veillonellaceae bacterium]